MYNETQSREFFDTVSVHRAGKEKKAHFYQDGLQISAQLKPYGQFINVLADIFRSVQAGKRSYH